MSTPVGPYAPSLRAGPWLVCSGQVGIAPGPAGPVLADGFPAQTRQALANVRGLLDAAGLGWPAVAKVTAFLSRMDDYAEFNRLYLEELGEHRPARSVVGVAALPLGALVEIEVWARTDGDVGQGAQLP